MYHMIDGKQVPLFIGDCSNNGILSIADNSGKLFLLVLGRK